MSYRGDLWTWQQASFIVSLLCRPRRNKNCSASVVNRELGPRLTANKNGFKRCFQGESVDPSKPPRFVYTGKGNRGAALSLDNEKGSPERGTTVRTLVSLRGRSRARVPHGRARCARQHPTHTPVTHSPVSLFIARFLKQCWPQHVGLSSPTRTQTHTLPWETESSTLDPRNAPGPFLVLTPVTQSTRLPPRRPRSTQPAGMLPSSGSLRLHLRSARVDTTFLRVSAPPPALSRWGHYPSSGSLRFHLRSVRVDATLPPGLSAAICAQPAWTLPFPRGLSASICTQPAWTLPSSGVSASTCAL